MISPHFLRSVHHHPADWGLKAGKIYVFCSDIFCWTCTKDGLPRRRIHTYAPPLIDKVGFQQRFQLINYRLSIKSKSELSR